MATETRTRNVEQGEGTMDNRKKEKEKGKRGKRLGRGDERRELASE